MDALASAADDLKEYERWLKDFIASEERGRKRHARSLEREQARYRRRLKRERTTRAGKRAAIGAALSIRSLTRSLLDGLGATMRRSADLTTAGAAWTGAKSRAVAVSSGKRLSLGWSWANTKGSSISRSTRRGAAIGASWLAARTRVLALESAKARATGAT